MNKKEAVELFRRTAELEIDKFMCSPELEKELGNILEFFFEEESEYKRGLLLTGTVGQGKSNVFTTVNRIFRLNNLRGRKFNFYTAPMLIQAVYDKDFIPLKSHHLVIDDFGTEAGRSEHAVRTMEELIINRYELWKNRNYLTSFTTNLSFDEIFNRYGDRVGDRIRQMTHTINFDFIKDGFRGYAVQLSEAQKTERMKNYITSIDKKKMQDVDIYAEMIKNARKLIEGNDSMHFSYWGSVYRKLLTLGAQIPLTEQHRKEALDQEKTEYLRKKITQPLLGDFKPATTESRAQALAVKQFLKNGKVQIESFFENR